MAGAVATQVGVAAVAGGMVLDEVAREHHLGVRNPGDDVARGVPGAEVEELDLAAPEEDRHRALEGERRPGEAGDRRGIAEQAREAAILRIPILLPALGEEHLHVLLLAYKSAVDPPPLRLPPCQDRNQRLRVGAKRGP